MTSADLFRLLAFGTGCALLGIAFTFRLLDFLARQVNPNVDSPEERLLTHLLTLTLLFLALFCFYLAIFRG